MDQTNHITQMDPLTELKLEVNASLMDRLEALRDMVDQLLNPESLEQAFERAAAEGTRRWQEAGI